MAIEAGIAALKMLYKLAKMIKEARDNVNFVREKLDNTESLAKLIEMNMAKIDPQDCPEEILKEIDKRFTASRRIARRLRMKYEPLVSLLAGLGGSATIIKAQSSILKKGVLGASMAIGSLIVMLQRHLDRLEARAIKSICDILSKCNVPTETFEKMNPQQLLDYLKSAGHGVSDAMGNVMHQIGDGSQQAMAMASDKLHSAKHALEGQVSAMQSKMQNEVGKLHEKMAAAQEKAQAAAGSLMDEAAGQFKNVQNGLSSAVDDVTDSLGVAKLNDAIASAEDKLTANASKLAASATNQAKGLKNQLESQAGQLREQMEEKAAYAMKEGEQMAAKAKAATEHLAKDAMALKDKMQDQAMDAMHQASHLMENTANQILKALEQAGFSLQNFEKVVSMYVDVRKMFQEIDHLAQELKQLNNKAQKEEEDDEDHTDAPDDIVPSIRKEKSEKKSLIKEGIAHTVQFLFNGKEFVDEDSFRKLMDKGYTKARFNLVRRSLGEGPDLVIPVKKFAQFVASKATDNVGLSISAVCQCLVDRLKVSGVPKIISDAVDVAASLAKPLINYAMSFGMLVAIEELRETVKEDPQEIAALEAEADEAAMERRMELVKAFATDFQECFTHGFTPDPALMISIAVEVSTSFIGLGPTTKRRLAIMMSIVNIINIETDKKEIEKVDNDMKSEISVISSLGSHKQTSQIEDIVQNAFDARRILGNGEAGEFWVSSFGKECFEVQWTRFRMAFLAYFGRSTDKTLKRMKLMLLDYRGNVTIEHVRAFEASTGSLSESVKQLSRGGKMPKVMSLDALVGNGGGEAGGNDDSPPPSRGHAKEGEHMSPTEKRQARLRLYGVLNQAQ